MKTPNTYIYLIVLLVLIVLAMLLSSCAQNEITTFTTEPYGFFSGIWHGIISPFSLIGMLIWPNHITMYAQNNTGFWYAFGFFIGIGGLGGSIGNSSK